MGTEVCFEMATKTADLKKYPKLLTGGRELPASSLIHKTEVYGPERDPQQLLPCIPPLCACSLERELSLPFSL